MEKCGKGEGRFVNGNARQRCCSACAGDYEDPERTAWRAGQAADSEEHGEDDDGGMANEAGDEP